MRRPIIDACANVNDKREPKAYNAPIFLNTSVAKKPGINIRMATIQNTIIEKCGVLNLGWRRLKIAGCRP